MATPASNRFCFAGNGNFGAETNWRETRLRAKFTVAETKRPIKSPPFAGLCRPRMRSQRSRECMVADAVLVEPDSTWELPANREINREP
jgi:hypothetical protein